MWVIPVRIRLIVVRQQKPLALGKIVVTVGQSSNYPDKLYEIGCE